MRRAACISLVLVVVVAWYGVVILGEYDSNITETTSDLKLPAPVITMFKNDKRYALLVSWDDGVNDMDFSFLEDELGIKHTSFVVTSRIADKKFWGLDIMFRGHDIQSHTREHKATGLANLSYCEYLISRSIVDIERTYGFTPIVLAYPYGSTNAITSEIALRYVDVARGTIPEGILRLGTWPIKHRGNARHSTFDLNGLSSENMDRLAERFYEMTKLEGNRAFKIYGHTDLATFNLTERAMLFDELKKIAFRNDTWYASWGEAIAYDILRTNTTIEDFSYDDSEVMFRTVTSANVTRYPVQLTYRVEIPKEWDSIVVYDDGRISSDFTLTNGTLLINSKPRNQTIRIVRTQDTMIDTEGPVIGGVTIATGTEGLLITFEVTDVLGFVTDVNMTVSVGNNTFFFNRIVNPIFWDNSTYGRAIFADDIQSSDGIDITICAQDSSGNLSSLSYQYQGC